MTDAVKFLPANSPELAKAMQIVGVIQSIFGLSSVNVQDAMMAVNIIQSSIVADLAAHKMDVAQQFVKIVEQNLQNALKDGEAKSKGESKDGEQPTQ